MFYGPMTRGTICDFITQKNPFPALLLTLLLGENISYIFVLFQGFALTLRRVL